MAVTMFQAAAIFNTLAGVVQLIVSTKAISPLSSVVGSGGQPRI